MQGETNSALADYLKLANERLARTGDEGTDHKGLIVLHSRSQELVSLVEQAEKGGQFARLVQATADNFSSDSSLRGSSKWKSHVQNFFRRNVIYQDTFSGKKLDTACVLDQYVDAFRRTEIKSTYFAPLEFISFAEEQMVFGDFEIRRFSKEELDQKLQQATYPAFYPWTAVDTGLLAQYWFLTCSENKPAPEPGRMLMHISIRVEPKYSLFPKAIETALKTLVLFQWGTLSRPLQRLLDLSALELWDGPARFGVPFYIEVSDSLIDHPTAMPRTDVLVTVPAEDPTTGEYLGEQPASGISVSEILPCEYQTTSRDFVEFARVANEILRGVCGVPSWSFIDIALNFLVKAFFSEGLEQLLWHITAIEAVLGENRVGGTTKLLTGRVGLILGDSEATLFGKLYDFRCDLVHGKKELIKNKLNLAHLGQAREIARRITLWMLRCLHHIREDPSASTYSRTHVLAALDGNLQSEPVVAELLLRLPSGFPKVPEWRN